MSDEHRIGEPQPGDPFALSARDVSRARITGVHRHFSPVNGEVFEFRRHESGWGAPIPGDPDGSTFSVPDLHSALRYLHHYDMSAEGSARADAEYREDYNAHLADMSRRMGGNANPGARKVQEDYARRMMDEDQRKVRKGDRLGPVTFSPN